MPERVTSSTTHIEVMDVTKKFGGVRALDRVSVAVRLGAVHALVGENGAGKSTLGKIVSGVIHADSGVLRLRGVPVTFRTPREALDHGVATISQEMAMVPDLTVAQNVLLGAEPRRSGVLRGREQRRRFLALRDEHGFDLQPDDQVRDLRTSEQQQVEILRALARDAEVIVMDEPSAALSAKETDKLHDLIRSLARAGRTLILISHFLDEVLNLADDVTVLRDGRVIQTTPAAEQTRESLIQSMLGRSLGAAFPVPRRPPGDSPVRLKVSHLSANGVDDASLTVTAGEIVGLAGLVGAGRTELARAIFGAERPKAGSVELVNGPHSGGPADSLRAGLAMLPESRKDAGLLFHRSVSDNATLATLPAFSTFGVVRHRQELRSAHAVLDRCGVKSDGYGALVSTLSGGNQQKVMLARMLLCGPAMLIADEPTRGVDIGAKRAIYDLLVELASEGMGVLLISSEVEEILGLAHRVLVMREGRIVTELKEHEMTEAAILAAAFAGSTPEEAVA